jgi:hypothetical protein
LERGEGAEKEEKGRGRGRGGGNGDDLSAMKHAGRNDLPSISSFTTTNVNKTKNNFIQHIRIFLYKKCCK